MITLIKNTQCYPTDSTELKKKKNTQVLSDEYLVLLYLPTACAHTEYVIEEGMW